MASLMEVVQRLQALGYLCTIRSCTNNKVAVIPLFVSHARRRLSISAAMFHKAEEGQDPVVSDF